MVTHGKDLVRQIGVLSATSFMIIAALVGGGAFGGTPVQDLQDGALAEDGSVLAPAGPAFSIWSVIYVLLVGYAVWQALPGQRARSRQRALGWWIALSAVLNGCWLLLAQFTTLPLTVAGIVALLLVLCIAFQRTVAIPAEGLLDSLLIDGSTGLHLGWVSLATVANTSAWLTATGPSEWADAATVLGVTVLIVVGIIAVILAWASGWHIAPALALTWGLSWLAVGRLTGEPSDVAIGTTAIVIAVVVLLVTAVGKAADRVIDMRNAEA
ncbi:TspO/MBR family protein [Microbacterium koreense]|uniref:TspO/MBR family protein n=1 Tax=Microbacterium koreense TaxID=323761 RepID=A0ABW2ZMN7_9MICO